MRKRFGYLVAVACAFAVVAAPAEAKTFTVCKHGCKYRTIQSAVDAVKHGSTSTIKVKPGTYSEGVQIFGHKYDGLSIIGSSGNPRDAVLNGKNATVPGKAPQPAQNGIDGTNVNGLDVENLWVKNYASNGIFFHADPGKDCDGFLMKHDLASFNRSYGLFAFNCIGGRITKSKGWGQGDSAFYIGNTPPQDNPKWTSIDHSQGFENVLGYSGTNSKYVDIHDNFFYNNGIGVVPNTLSSEDFQPTADGKIRNNDIFWNNFDYWRKSSRVLTVSNGLGNIGIASIQYPIGIGIFMLGADGWVIKDNNIFGNFMWGTAASSDPTNETHSALNQNNHYTSNTNGRNGTDVNQFDYFNDGSGSGNCYSDNDTQTFDMAGTSTTVSPVDYPSCPAPPPPVAGTGNDVGDPAQVGYLVNYVTSDPPCNQENSWAKHDHPKFKNFKPLNTTGPCTNLPSKAKARAGKSTPPKQVKVADDYYAPVAVSVPKFGKVKWVWDGITADVHNVTLYKAPNGVTKSDFRSQSANSGTFTRKFKKPGTYQFHCTLHKIMDMSVKVKKPA
jgi:plastocyanin